MKDTDCVILREERPKDLKIFHYVQNDGNTIVHRLKSQFFSGHWALGTIL